MTKGEQINGSSRLVLVRRGRQFAIGVSAFAGFVGILVVLGWMLDSSLLVSVIPGAAKMMPNTAIGFMLVAHALWYRSVSVAGTRHVQSWYATLANVCAGLAVLVGLVTLVEYLAGFDLGIDTLLFPGRLLADRGTYPGRMSEAGAKMEILDEGVIAPTGAATFDRFHQCAKARCRL